MKKSILIQALIVVFALGGADVYGQDRLGAGPKKARTPEDYSHRILKEIVIASEAEFGEKESMGVVFGDILPSRVRVTFKRSQRTLPGRKKALLHRWAQRYAGAPEHYTVPYKTEMLFSDDGSNYWLTVRKQLASRLAKELRRGEAVDLFLIRLGRLRTASGWEPLLLVESFQRVM